MSKHILAAVVVLLIAGGFSFVAANGTYVIPGKWYGLITDTMDARKGTHITADEIKKSVASGAKYALINGMFFQPYIELSPADKVAPFAGKTAFVNGAITTNSLLKGAVYIPDSDAAPGAFTIKVTTIEPHEDAGIWYLVRER